MAAWSKDSCAQWMLPSREPRAVPSVMGVRPALKSMGTLERAALTMSPMALAVPGRVCTITTCGRPVIMV